MFLDERPKLPKKCAGSNERVGLQHVPTFPPNCLIVGASNPCPCRYQLTCGESGWTNTPLWRTVSEHGHHSPRFDRKVRPQSHFGELLGRHCKHIEKTPVGIWDQVRKTIPDGLPILKWHRDRSRKNEVFAIRKEVRQFRLLGPFSGTIGFAGLV
jgi:hypothetical protein